MDAEQVSDKVIAHILHQEGEDKLQATYSNIRELCEQVNDVVERPSMNSKNPFRTSVSTLIDLAVKLEEESNTLRDIRDNYDWDDNESVIEYEITRTLNQSNFARLQALGFINILGSKRIIKDTSQAVKVTKMLASIGIVIAILGIILQYSGYTYVEPIYEPLPNGATPMKFHTHKETL